MDDTVERVILVDADDRPEGDAPKLEAHRLGLRHRAFSVLIHDGAGRQLLQRRALSKYHSPGLWSNACCGHPRPGELTVDAAARRLHEELGFRCDLETIGRLEYSVRFDNDLGEHEVVTLYRGTFTGSVFPDPAEAEEVAWVERPDLLADLRARPEAYTYWFRLYMLEHAHLLHA